MTQIVITGSTGVIGRRAVRELLAAGHRVTGVTRSVRGREGLESLGAKADVFDGASLRRTFDGADAVVNLLTHPDGGRRGGEADRASTRPASGPYRRGSAWHPPKPGAARGGPTPARHAGLTPVA
jgi:uncharacterized protein YbjT (DUF2867 family)